MQTTVPSHKVLMRITWEKARKALSKLSAFNKYELLVHVYVYFNKFFKLWKYRMLHSPRMTMRLWYDSLKPKEVNYSEVENTQMTSHLHSNLISCTFLSRVQYYNWLITCLPSALVSWEDGECVLSCMSLHPQGRHWSTQHLQIPNKCVPNLSQIRQKVWGEESTK